MGVGCFDKFNHNRINNIYNNNKDYHRLFLLCLHNIKKVIMT